MNYAIYIYIDIYIYIYIYTYIMCMKIIALLWKTSNNNLSTESTSPISLPKKSLNAFFPRHERLCGVKLHFVSWKLSFFVEQTNFNNGFKSAGLGVLFRHIFPWWGIMGTMEILVNITKLTLNFSAYCQRHSFNLYVRKFPGFGFYKLPL